MEILQFNGTTIFTPQCLVCCTSSMNAYVDLAASHTSHSETPVKEKIRSILKEKWVADKSEDAFIMCLPCFHLIDQFDALETQLKFLQDEICNKYMNSNGIIQIVCPEDKFIQAEQQIEFGLLNGDTMKRATTQRKQPANKGKESLEGPPDQLTINILKVEGPKKAAGLGAATDLQWPGTTLALYESGLGADPGGGGVGGEGPLLLTGLPTVAWTLPASALSGPPPLRPFSTNTRSAPAPAPALASDPGPPPLRLLSNGSHITLDGFPLASSPPPLRPFNMTHAMEEDGVADDPDPVSDPLSDLVPAAGPDPAGESDIAEGKPQTLYDLSLPGLGAGERIRIAVSAGPGPERACCYCAQSLADAAAAVEHFRAEHRPQLIAAALPPHLGLGPSANCAAQLASVAPAAGSAAAARPFVCLFCDGAFKFKSNILLHFRDKHSPHLPYACPDCGEAYRRTIELSRHRVYHCAHRPRLAGAAGRGRGGGRGGGRRPAAAGPTGPPRLKQTQLA